jgi:hypothetical protein
MTTRAIYLSCSFTAGTRVNARVQARVTNCSLIYRRFLFIFGMNILHITTSNKGYVLFMFTHRAHAWFNSQQSLNGFSSNLMSTYYKWPQVTWDTYWLYLITACMRACVCERACVIKRSLIFEGILFKFGGDIKQIPIGYMSYLICVWMHVLTVRTCLHLRISLARDGQWLVYRTI